MEIMKVGAITQNDYKDSCGLLDDFLITVRTRRDDEEPYFMLYQCASNKPRGYSSIAQVKLTENSPKTIDDINTIYVSPSITNECKSAILEWSKATDSWGIYANWVTADATGGVSIAANTAAAAMGVASMVVGQYYMV